jgi:hypothetical protein
MLARHRPTLDALAARLLEEETLEGEALQDAIAPIELEMAADTELPASPAPQRQRTRRPRAARPRVDVGT